MRSLDSHVGKMVRVKYKGQEQRAWEWCKLIEVTDHTVTVNPDGWGRKTFTYAWKDIYKIQAFTKRKSSV